MHEVLLTRGDVAGCAFEVQMQIYVPMNVVLVHPGACHVHAQHQVSGKTLCVQQLLQFNTYDEITRWLAYMETIMVSEQPVEARRLIDAYLSYRLRDSRGGCPPLSFEQGGELPVRQDPRQGHEKG